MKLKQMGIALIAAGMLSANAYASEVAVEQALAPQAAFSETDLNALFEQEMGKPMQLAALSEQEMRETEGALIPAMVYGSLIGLGTYAYKNWNNMTWGGALRSAALGAVPFGGTAIAGRIAAGSAWNTARGIGIESKANGWRLAYHGPHHPFPVIGKQPHIQLNRWTPNVRRSGREPIRIPW